MAKANPGLYAEMTKVNNKLIDLFLNVHDDKISEAFKEFSKMQFRLMLPMIPMFLRDIWNQGLTSDNYYLKLCGSGGGGYFLCYSPHFQEAIEHFPLTRVSFHNS